MRRMAWWITLPNVEEAANAMAGAIVSEAVRYDPFARGRFPVGVRTFEALDTGRNRRFPSEVWYPAAGRHARQDLAPETQDNFQTSAGATPRRQMAVRDAVAEPGTYPLVIFSHHSGGNRRAATFLCTHLASHGYVVAGLDHSEVIAAELAATADETKEQKAARFDAVIASRVPDARFLLTRLLDDPGCGPELQVDRARIGIAGHSFGGWTALALPDVEPRIGAVVALAPGGASNPRPGVLPLTLAFAWGRDVPTLYLVAENDVCLPLDGMYEIFERTPAAKQMVILRRADHMHFMDNVEEMHEMFRHLQLPEELQWLQKEMRSIKELSSGEQAHLFVRGLTLCHMDAMLKGNEAAERFLEGDLEAELAARGIEARAHRNSR